MLKNLCHKRKNQYQNKILKQLNYIILFIVIFIGCNKKNKNQPAINRIDMVEWNKSTINYVVNYCNLEKTYSHIPENIKNENRLSFLECIEKSILKRKIIIRSVDSLVKKYNLNFSHEIVFIESYSANNAPIFNDVYVEIPINDEFYITFQLRDNEEKISNFKKQKGDLIKSNWVSKKLCINKINNNNYINELYFKTSIVFENDNISYQTKNIYIEN